MYILKIVAISSLSFIITRLVMNHFMKKSKCGCQTNGVCEKKCCADKTCCDCCTCCK